MSYKIINFSANGKTMKEFATSLIKQRIREQKRTLKFRFRQLIRDYTALFKTGKDIESTEALFRKDVIMILSEAVSKVQEGGSTINRYLGISTLIPATRSIINKFNIIIRKISKFYDKNGYINKIYQNQFNELFIKLIDAITEKVRGGEVQLPDNDEETEETTENTPKKFSATKIVMYSAEVDNILDTEDLDDVNIESVEDDKIVMNEDSVPKEFSGKYHKLSVRTKNFNSSMKVIEVSEAHNGESADKLIDKVISDLKAAGKMNPEETMINYDAEINGENIDYKIYVKPYKSDVVDNKYSEITSVIDSGLNLAKLIKLESMIKDINKDELSDYLIKKYGSNPLVSIM